MTNDLIITIISTIITAIIAFSIFYCVAKLVLNSILDRHDQNKDISFDEDCLDNILEELNYLIKKIPAEFLQKVNIFHDEETVSH